MQRDNLFVFGVKFFRNVCLLVHDATNSLSFSLCSKAVFFFLSEKNLYLNQRKPEVRKGGEKKRTMRKEENQKGNERTAKWLSFLLLLALVFCLLDFCILVLFSLVGGWRVHTRQSGAPTSVGFNIILFSLFLSVAFYFQFSVWLPKKQKPTR